MSNWDYIDLPRSVRGAGVTIAAHETGTGQVQVTATDDEGSVSLLLNAFQSKELGKALFEAGHRAEWYQITQRTL